MPGTTIDRSCRAPSAELHLLLICLFVVHRFLLEAIEDLRGSLRSKGSDLVIRRGKPEDVVPELIKSLPNVTAVYLHSEVRFNTRT